MSTVPPVHEVRQTVTRNVPPKRGLVVPGTTITVAGQAYEGGDEVLLPGPEADALALDGFIVITSHDEITAWNGKEGRDLHKQAMAHIAMEGDTPDHDHGFGKYQHADGADATEVEVTNHRARIAQENMLHGRQAEESDFKGGKR